MPETLGIGVDLCAVSRIERAIQKAHFLNRVFTEAERAYLQGRGRGAGESAAAMFAAKEAVARDTNPNREKGSLADVLRGADVFLGVSAPGLLTADMVKTMNSGAIVFAMANPTPEIFPDEAKAAGAAVVATGRSDFPNQINNCLGFPGIFKGALDVRAARITESMKIAAAHALAGLVPEAELTAENIIPAALDPRVVPAVASAVSQAARDAGVSRI